MDSGSARHCRCTLESLFEILNGESLPVAEVHFAQVLHRAHANAELVCDDGAGLLGALLRAATNDGRVDRAELRGPEDRLAVAAFVQR